MRVLNKGLLFGTGLKYRNSDIVPTQRLEFGRLRPERMIYRLASDYRLLGLLVGIQVDSPVEIPVGLVGLGSGATRNLYLHVPESDRETTVTILTDPVVHLGD